MIEECDIEEIERIPSAMDRDHDTITFTRHKDTTTNNIHKMGKKKNKHVVKNKDGTVTQVENPNKPLPFGPFARSARQIRFEKEDVLRRKTSREGPPRPGGWGTAMRRARGVGVGVVN